MGNTQKRRLDPKQVDTARELFSGGLRLTVAEVAARMSKPKHPVDESVVRRVLEANGWKRPQRAFTDLEERHLDEIRVYICERSWNAERAADLYGIEHNDAAFQKWLSSIGASLNGRTDDVEPEPSAKSRSQREPRRSRSDRDKRSKRAPARSSPRTTIEGDPESWVEVRDDTGMLLDTAGGRPFWARKLSDDELACIGARFFPDAKADYKRNRAVIQSVVGCRKNGQTDNIAQFVSAKNRVPEDAVRELVIWLRGD